MAPDIVEVTNILLEDKVWGAVQHHIAYYHAPEVNVFPTHSHSGTVCTVCTTVCYSCAAHIILIFVDPCILVQFIKNPKRCNSVSNFY
jgi:hypothetical protein